MKRPPPESSTTLRIIGGRLRGKRLEYHGDPRTRPMKDRVREAVFNLVGPAIRGSHAFDLFAGTGAVALEALSRGAARATAIERHFPTARAVRDNARALGVENCIVVEGSDSFFWVRRAEKSTPNGFGPELPVVFVCPPYALYRSQAEDMRELVASMRRLCGDRGILVVEADSAEPFAAWSDEMIWDVRTYPPAVVGILRWGDIPASVASPSTKA